MSTKNIQIAFWAVLIISTVIIFHVVRKNKANAQLAKINAEINRVLRRHNWTYTGGSTARMTSDTYLRNLLVYRDALRRSWR